MSELRDQIAEANPDAILLEPESLDKAIVGMAERCGMQPVVVYSVKKLVRCFQRQGMSYDDAREWVEFNILGAYLGDHNPVFISEVLT